MTQRFSTSIAILLLLLSPYSIPAFSTQFTQAEQNEDHLVVVKNHQVIFDVIKKNLNNQILSVKLTKQPMFGEVLISSLDSLTYIPTPNICEEKDAFEYTVQTQSGEETIKVQVEILCESLTIISGFTPNADGNNGTFTILGIENFPNNSLTIFNKWGEQVFYKKNYANDWSGELPDGDNVASNDNVYYYVFNNGEGKVYSGYLQVGEES